MSFRLQFEGVRCFVEPQDAVVRPLTLLVGENSSGKSTFLALCRLAHAIALRWVRHLPFNEPPFLLGAYDQIASNLGGRRGRASSFSLAIVIENVLRPSLHAEFESKSGQASLQLLRLSVGDLSLAVRAKEGELVTTLQSSQGEKTFPAGREGGIPAVPGDLLMTVMHTPVQRQDWGTSARGVFSESDMEALEDARRAIRTEFRRQPYAIAPIRTSPRRTYDPVEPVEEPEGSHVPMILAGLSRSASSEQWARLRSALNKFGSRSGLFEEIQIVNKGEEQGDPFQVGIKTGGPVFNLIDVGYGVSQALPILVDTLRRPSFRFFLIQQPEVHLHPRAQAELGSFFAHQAESGRQFVIETHSDHLVDRIRLEVRNKVLRPEDVSLLYFERHKHGATIHNLELDNSGSITNAPPGYREFFLNEERSLLGV